jgi:hypothetical protein
MWLAPYTPGAAHTVTLTLPRAERLRALRVWNYNKSEEDALRGARTLAVTVDGAPATPPGGVSLRRAPGGAAFDFGQTVPLLPAAGLGPSSSPPY